MLVAGVAILIDIDINTDVAIFNVEIVQALEAM